uniref:C3H1-type domain-containing protein n=1 Tax=Oryza rufipogon TaxID=4529 RepID=A0A0E0PYJ7_ORYRU
MTGSGGARLPSSSATARRRRSQSRRCWEDEEGGGAAPTATGGAGLQLLRQVRELQVRHQLRVQPPGSEAAAWRRRQEAGRAVPAAARRARLQLLRQVRELQVWDELQVQPPSPHASATTTRGKSKVEQVKLNVLGLPLRPGTGLCSYYMNRGICKFGTNCKFDHPDPGSDHEKWVVSSNANQVSSQPGIPSFHQRISYTRDQLLQLCQNVEVPKDILKFCQDINVELNGEDKISGFGAEKDHVSILPFSYVIMAEIVCAALINVPQRCKVLYFIVQTPSYKRFDATDSRDWHSWSAQTNWEQKFWDNFSEAKEPYSLGWKQEKFNKPDQSSFHFDSKDQQDDPISVLVKAEVPLSIQRGIISGKDEVLKTLKSILNTFTPKMFDLQKGQLIETRISSADILKDVINLIFEKVVAEPTFCSTYAQLCTYLNQNLTPFPPEDCDCEEITFKQALSNKCQEIFESAHTVCSEIGKLIGQDREMEQRDKERVVKLETLGNINFIRALLKKKLITNKIIDHIVQVLKVLLNSAKQFEDTRGLCSTTLHTANTPSNAKKNRTNPNIC